ncbi:Oidioi.mRNA.OKI2018_I69.chr1.g3911.t1.cds [Oikopleura dioica]|uniref:Oidioi.mRNA.OKI2018_I69.chr1.g3911.t1.cds n=1 Tax=Oikopleura dioica TaxID=34765 RepID=A0ABN7T154_OIKDI|nr:Oidioi.mRNA.OKI2018_I69.chr1.g3911.t1.cds [Oikopleura dioica]
MNYKFWFFSCFFIAKGALPDEDRVVVRTGFSRISRSVANSTAEDIFLEITGGESLGEKMTLKAQLNIFNYTAHLTDCDIFINSKTYRILESETVTSTGLLLNVQKLSSWTLELKRFSTSASKMEKMDFQCEIRLSSCLPSADPLGYYYTGHRTVTNSGRTCQKWSSQWPHSHSYRNQIISRFGERFLNTNYCRNPDNYNGGVWCYTTDPSKRWELCEIPTCDF